MSNGDIISNLPVDNTAMANQQDLHLVNTLFTEGNNKVTVSKVLDESKDALLVGLLFIVFSVPPLTNLLHKVFKPSANSVYIEIFIKAILIAITWWIIKHFYLSRNNI